MDSQFERIRFHFMEAMDLTDTKERKLYIEKSCRDHPEIGDRLQAMYLAQRDNEKAEASRPEESTFDKSTFGENFDVIRLLGEGGFGEVYLAQEHKPLRRMVALKVLKPGMDSKEVIERFRTEQGALAIMNHPSISKVLETGTTRDGRPFFVMEYVEGLPITDYCDENELSIRDRLELFSEVCHAVAHAHQKGVIHRDLKPSNIMVAEFEGNHLPKVIDFGIAKAITPELQEDSFKTRNFHLIGSPLYMSPEQAGKKEHPIDTRTDVYSMGALLFQLVVGVPTYDPDRLMDTDLLSTLEIIKEESIPSVSHRLDNLKSEEQTDCARKRCHTLSEHSKTLRGEISWIIGKTIEKDPDERYQSIMDLDQDIQNYLNNRPLTARPPSRIYLARKFVRRNRLGVSLATTVSVVLVAALIFSLWQLDRAINAERLADIRLSSARTAQEAARNLVYAGDIGLAAEEEKNGDVSAAISLLKNHVPLPDSGKSDLRGIEWSFLYRLLTRDHRVIAKNPFGFCLARYLPESKWLAIGDYQGNMTLLDAQSNQPLHSFSAHKGMVNFVDISPDGKELATVGDDGYVRIWNPFSSSAIKEFKVDQDEAHRVYFLNTSNRLITAGKDSSVKIWDRLSGEKVDELDGIDTDIRNNLALSPDGSFVVTTPRHFSVRAFEVGKWHQPTVKYDTGDRGGFCRCMAISHDTSLVAAGRKDFSVTVWDTKTGAVLHQLKGHHDDVQSMTFHPTGKLLASSDRSGVIRFWNLARSLGEPNPALEQWPAAMMAHPDRAWSIDFSPDGSNLVTAGRDGTVKLWTGQQQRKLDVDVSSYYSYQTWKNNDELLCSEMNQLFLWNVNTGKRKLIDTFPEKICAIEMDRSKNHYAVATYDGNVQLYRAEDDTKTRVFDAHHSKAIYSVKFSAGDSKLLFTTGGDQRAACWDLENGKLVDELRADRNFDDIGITKDNSQVLLCFENNILRWDLESRQAPVHLLGHKNTAECLSLCENRSVVVTGSDDRTIKVWDLKSGELKHTISGHDYKICCIACSPVGNTVVTGDDNGFLSFSNIRNGRFIMQYDLKRFWPHVTNQNFTDITAIRFSPDHSKLAVSLARRGTLVFDCSFSSLSSEDLAPFPNSERNGVRHQ